MSPPFGSLRAASMRKLRTPLALLVTALAIAGLALATSTANAMPDGGYQEIKEYKVIDKYTQWDANENRYKYYEVREYKQKTCIEVRAPTQDGGGFSVIKCF
jgi:hypothetical protein